MSQRRATGQVASEYFSRARKAWSLMPTDRRVAALIAVLLFISMWFPWYEKSYGKQIGGVLQQQSDALSAFGAFSFVEAAVLLVAIAVLFLLFSRADGKRFKLPGGDGTVIFVAGGWTAILIIIRMFDKPGAAPGELGLTVGINWGIFLALFLSMGLAYIGWRIREQEQRVTKVMSTVATDRRPERRRPSNVRPPSEPPRTQRAREAAQAEDDPTKFGIQQELFDEDDEAPTKLF